MIARVLSQEPRIILLDEPVSHLDVANQSRLLELLKKLTESGIAVLAVLHDPNAAFLYGDSIFFLTKGSIVMPHEGKTEWDSGFLSEVYGVELDSVPYQGRALIIPSRRGGGYNGTQR